MNARLIALVSALLVLASCVGTGQDGGGGPVDVLLWGEPEEMRGYRKLVEEFSRREPGIEVRLIETADRDDMLARLSTSFAGGSPPDLFLLNYRFVGQYVSRGVLEPLEERLESSDVFAPEDFFPQAMEAFTFDGVQTCLPQNVSSLVVYYNRDLFREAGLPEPEAGWTWADMTALAQQLTVDEDRDGRPERYGLGVEPSIVRVAPFIWSNGGSLVDDERDPARLAVDDLAGIAVLDSFFQLREGLRVIPAEREIEAQDDESRFLNGTTAMVFASRRETPSFRTITEFDWDVAPLPTFGTPAGVLHSDAYCMARQSGAKDDAWRFLEFALGPEGQRITAEAGRTVPSLIDVANSEAFLDPEQPPSNSEVFLETIPHIRRLPNSATWPEVEERADEILELGMYHRLSPVEVARRLVRETAPILERG